MRRASHGIIVMAQLTVNTMNCGTSLMSHVPLAAGGVSDAQAQSGGVHVAGLQLYQAGIPASITGWSAGCTGSAWAAACMCPNPVRAPAKTHQSQRDCTPAAGEPLAGPVSATWRSSG